MLNKLTLKVRRKEGFLPTCLYNIVHRVQRINIPDFLLPFYRVLYVERQFRVQFFRRLTTLLYYGPMFRSKCSNIGKQFNYVKLQQVFPYISGNIKIVIGDNVTLHSRSSLAASKVFNNPVLRVGSHTYLGPGLSISVAKEITIGSYCHLASNVTISDNDGHPLDPLERAAHSPVDTQDIKPVHIEDYAWIGRGAIILKGVSVGKSAVVGANSLVSLDVEPFSVVAGNPARLIKRLSSTM
ncbi:MAG: acyltransferase [Anaerolineaceae bacterium]